MWEVVSYKKNGEILNVSKPMSYESAANLWHRKNSRSPRRFAIRKAA